VSVQSAWLLFNARIWQPCCSAECFGGLWRSDLITPLGIGNHEVSSSIWNLFAQVSFFKNAQVQINSKLNEKIV